ncbi:MAG: sensor histidine kinase, partial [Microcystaceae cyanobacterium]
TIRMGIEVLRKCPPSPEELQQRLDIIEKEWRKLQEINERILKLRTLKFDHSSFYFQPVEIIPFLENFLQSQPTQALLSISHKHLILETQWLEKSPVIQIDIHFLDQILQELITNIEKFSFAQSTVTIEIKEKLIFGKQRVEIHFQNRSHCVSPKNLKYLFDPFYREQWAINSAIPGIGLGLSIIKTLVEQLDGTIEVNSFPTDNPEICLINFVLSFPTENITNH